MKKLKNRRRWIIAACGALALVLVGVTAGVLFLPGTGPAQAKTLPEPVCWHSDPPTSGTYLGVDVSTIQGELIHEGDVQNVYAAVALASYTREELLKGCNVALTCRLEEVSDAYRLFAPHHIDNYTNYYFTPIDIYRGKEFVGDYVTLRVPGGLAGGYNIEYSDSYHFEVGKEYLLLLQTPNYQGGNATPDEYFTLMGGIYGVYTNSGSTAPLTEDTTLKSGTGDLVKLGKMIRDIEAVNETDPPVEDIAWQMDLAAFKASLEGGVFTQEAYEEMTTPADTYAVYVTEIPQYSKAKK